MSATNIKSIMVVGERCSGTNWLTRICHSNFDVFMHNCGTGHGLFGWKHNPEGFAHNDLLTQERDHTLFIFITRNLCDWIEHFFNNAWHVPRKYLESRETFLKHEPWMCFEKNNGTGEEISDVDKQTGERFRNLLDLRAKKHKYWRKLCVMDETSGGETKNPTPRLPHSVWIRYEDLLVDPSKFLEHLARTYSLKRTNKNHWNTMRTQYKGNRGKVFDFKKCQKDSFHFNCSLSALKWPSSVLKYTQKNADWDFERTLGYEEFSKKFLNL